jgi:hypothetical protein
VELKIGIHFPLIASTFIFNLLLEVEEVIRDLLWGNAVVTSDFFPLLYWFILWFALRRWNRVEGDATSDLSFEFFRVLPSTFLLGSDGFVTEEGWKSSSAKTSGLKGWIQLVFKERFAF